MYLYASAFCFSEIPPITNPFANAGGFSLVAVQSFLPITATRAVIFPFALKNQASQYHGNGVRSYERTILIEESIG